MVKIEIRAEAHELPATVLAELAERYPDCSSAEDWRRRANHEGSYYIDLTRVVELPEVPRVGDHVSIGTDDLSDATVELVTWFLDGGPSGATVAITLNYLEFSDVRDEWAALEELLADGWEPS